MTLKEKLAQDLWDLGIWTNDTILVHTSLNGLNTCGLTPHDIIDGLLLAVENGTLLVPALSYTTVTKENPIFHVNETKSCIGIVPEIFRLEYATHRSIHPTHSVCARGVLAASLTNSHKRDNTPVGEHSPFRLLPQVEGKILMLGCGLKPNTFMHGVEEAAKASYPLAKTSVKYTIDDGISTYHKEYFPHAFGELEQRYDRLENLLSPPDLVKGNVLRGTAYLMNAKAAMETAAIAICKNDMHFVDKA